MAIGLLYQEAHVVVEGLVGAQDGNFHLGPVVEGFVVEIRKTEGLALVKGVFGGQVIPEPEVENVVIVDIGHVGIGHDYLRLVVFEEGFGALGKVVYGHGRHVLGLGGIAAAVGALDYQRI